MLENPSVVIGLIVVSLVAVAVALFAMAQTRALSARFSAALGGQAPESIETTLARHFARVEAVDKRLGELEREYERLSIMVGLASQKISVVRFNPFGDTGGDQSFSLAVLDSHDSGYVLTSIHGRQGTRVYVKPIDFGKSKYQLSAEEEQAFSQAAKRVPAINREK